MTEMDCAWLLRQWAAAPNLGDIGPLLAPDLLMVADEIDRLRADSRHQKLLTGSAFHQTTPARVTYTLTRD